MKNIMKTPFGNPKVQVGEVKEEIGVITYPKEVLEIHHEFFTAADKLVSEANVILENAAKQDITKVSRLEKFGFKQANQVTELKPLIEAAKLSEEQLQLLKDYSMKYPNNKFITEEQVKAICYKYNLVCGVVGRYKGFVPEKNLKQIEDFKLRKEDELDKIVVFLPESGKIENLDWTKVTDKNKVGYLINTYLVEYGYSYISSGHSPYSTYPEYTRIVNRYNWKDKGFL
jgi:hypothetical protein